MEIECIGINKTTRNFYKKQRYIPSLLSDLKMKINNKNNSHLQKKIDKLEEALKYEEYDDIKLEFDMESVIRIKFEPTEINMSSSIQLFMQFLGNSDSFTSYDNYDSGNLHKDDMISCMVNKDLVNGELVDAYNINNIQCIEFILLQDISSDDFINGRKVDVLVNKTYYVYKNNF